MIPHFSQINYSLTLESNVVLSIYRTLWNRSRHIQSKRIHSCNVFAEALPPFSVSSYLQPLIQVLLEFFLPVFSVCADAFGQLKCKSLGGREQKRMDGWGTAKRHIFHFTLCGCSLGVCGCVCFCVCAWGMYVYVQTRVLSFLIFILNKIKNVIFHYILLKSVRTMPCECQLS